MTNNLQVLQLQQQGMRVPYSQAKARVQLQHLQPMTTNLRVLQLQLQQKGMRVLNQQAAARVLSFSGKSSSSNWHCRAAMSL
jgi:hypothetical protein